MTLEEETIFRERGKEAGSRGGEAGDADGDVDVDVDESSSLDNLEMALLALGREREGRMMMFWVETPRLHRR